MSTGEKKPTATPTTPPQTVTKQEPKPAQTAKRGLLSRRTFLKVAVGASTVLAGASMASSGQILAPLLPQSKDPEVVANALDLESAYDGVRNTRSVVYRFFSWPYTESQSPYYKNVLTRLPDELVPDPGSSPSISHYAAWNTTCVHLRCILFPPGFNNDVNEYRLNCPCHGSQYRLRDAVPVAGPAFFQGLRPLPRIRLSLDSDNNIIAEEFVGEPGIGRTEI